MTDDRATERPPVRYLARRHTVLITGRQNSLRPTRGGFWYDHGFWEHRRPPRPNWSQWCFRAD